MKTFDVDSCRLFPEIEECPPVQLEKFLFSKGYRLIAGTDEVGRGCLAGPVFAAAVILPPDHGIEGIKDSKMLTARQRELLSEKIKEVAVSWALGVVEVSEIDRINIFQASLKAMCIAVQALSSKPDILLLDGKHSIPLFIPQKPTVKGDRHFQSVGAASIIAKVARDRLMCDLEKRFPKFSFSVHKGYPTAQHREEIRKHGPTSVHRMSFKLLEEDS